MTVSINVTPLNKTSGDNKTGSVPVGGEKPKEEEGSK